MSGRICWVGLLLGLSGCLIQNLSPETRLRDSVIELNEGARWGRMDVAAGRVSPVFQNQFRLSHMRWGRDIQIADSEILAVNAHTDEDGSGAVSRVAIRWYDHETMVIAQTIVRQAWQKHKQTFLLTNESVESGHPGLLAVPEVQQPAEGPVESEEYEDFDDAQWSSAE
ncbi:MAG: hypothetical protein OEM15_05620 [Myxococcales bacterium]|nr:hypothetical protein [Myxococcales bacterium]MDH3485110.1 hypothetical protein [Myxococcales bacterium]